MQIEFNIYLAVLALTFLCGLVRFSKLTGPFRLLLVLVAYVFFDELNKRFVLPNYFESAVPVYHLTTWMSIGLYALIYLKFFGSDERLRRLAVISSLVLGLLAALNSWLYQGIYTFPSFNIAAQGILCILLALLLFKKMVESPVKTPLAKQPIFWFNLGTIVFFSFTFGSFVFFNEYKMEALTSWIFYLNVVGNWILYTCYGVAFYLNQKMAHG